MQIVDANVLVYAIDDESAHHRIARGWLDGALGGQQSIAFAWTVLVGFLRVSTQAALFRHPLSIHAATAAIEEWLAQPVAVLLDPAAGHLQTLTGLVGDAGSAGNLVNDAHLAALAIEHGAEVVSFDRDFGRFEGVRWRIPG